MSEQINKVLASTSQSFTTGEQAQARANINAAPAGDYAYNSSLSSKMDLSASSQFYPASNPSGFVGSSGLSSKQDASAMSSYVAYSAISADASGNITAIAGSSIGGTGGIYRDSNLSGSGTSGEPLGLASAVTLSGGPSYYPATKLEPGSISVSSQLSPSIQVKRDESSYVTIGQDYVSIMHSASGVGGGSTLSTYGEGINLNYNAGEHWLRHVTTDASGIRASYNGNNSAIAIYGFGKALFTDDSGATWEAVNPSSIRKWNSGVSAAWNESANSLGTGFGGNAAVSASQYNYGGAYDNWACREVCADGVPAQQLYGFQTPPASGSSEYVINGNGQFVSHRNPYECHVFNLTGNSSNYDWEQESAYPSGLPYDMRIDFIVYGTGEGYVLVNLDAAGNTADLRTGESASMFYDHTASSWHGQVGTHNIV